MRDYEPYYTEDGSIGLYSYADNDVYHSKFGALTEAWEKFVLPANIDDLMIRKKNIKVLDICYGIGYNTKALMNYILNSKKNFLKKKSLIKKIVLLVSIGINKIYKKITGKILISIATIEDNNSIIIDCLDTNEQLIKISPFFITIKTPEEIFSYIIPEFFSCFKLYYFFLNIFTKIISLFYPKNNKNINELLELKFGHMHIDKEYRLNMPVNYILINKLSEMYKDNYLDNETKKIFSKSNFAKFFDKYCVNYAKFNQYWGYNLLNKHNLSAFLHNIYYSHLSKRYNGIDFKKAEKLFNINFYIQDARKSIKVLTNTYDVIFLDAFTYTKAPQLWSVEFVKELYDKLSEQGVLLTYSNSAQIRNTLLENNFFVGKIYNSKTKKFNGTIASKDKSKIEYPLNNFELGLCTTKAGIPYHDPNLSFSAKDIMDLREYEFKHSNLMSSSKYMKIRSMRGEND